MNIDRDIRCDRDDTSTRDANTARAAASRLEQQAWLWQADGYGFVGLDAATEHLSRVGTQAGRQIRSHNTGTRSAQLRYCFDRCRRCALIDSPRQSRPEKCIDDDGDTGGGAELGQRRNLCNPSLSGSLVVEAGIARPFFRRTDADHCHSLPRSH